jgi:ABC-type glycerol-3-phosphate transport system permease component
MLALPPALRALAHILLITLGLAVIAPIAMVVGTALKGPAETFSLLPFPLEPTLANFRAIIVETPFLTYLGNSVGTTFLRVSGQVVFALLAAYGFARWRFPGRDLLFALVLGAMMIPHQLTVIPIYRLIADLDWFDSWAGLVVPNLAAPFGAFLLRQHLLAFPPSLYEAAELDGAGPLRALWHVVLPAIRPALSALAIFLFIECWNEYFWPLLVAPGQEARTLQVGLRAFLEAEYTNYGLLMAGVTLASLPALAFFLMLQRQVLQTFTSSGMTG